MAKEARHDQTPIGCLVAPDWEKIEAEWARRDRNEPTPEERRLTAEYETELKARVGLARAEDGLVRTVRGYPNYDVPDLPPEAWRGTATAYGADGEVLGEGAAAFDALPGGYESLFRRPPR